MLRGVALVRTDVWEECIASIISVIRIVLRLLVTANDVPGSPILVALMMEVIRLSETSVITSATKRNITGDGIAHSFRRENLKSYMLTPYAVRIISKCNLRVGT
jgi:hypothetical protein